MRVADRSPRHGARHVFALAAALFGLTALAVATSLPALAQSQTQPQTLARIAPLLFPDKLGARGALTFTIEYAAARSGVPEPLRHATLMFPAGMSIEVPHLYPCSPAALRARGPAGCSPKSLLGSGHALAEVAAGSQLISEHIALWAFLGPPRNLVPTLELLGQGYTPFDERFVFSGTVLTANPPYGEELEMPMPAIASLPLEPDASIVSFTLTVGEHHSHRAATDSVVVPSVCPLGGFPFAAAFTYADGSSGNATATAPCPR
jgi:hypothetical protein